MQNMVSRMRSTRLLALPLLALACAQPQTATTAASEIRTIADAPVTLLPIQQPPTIDEPPGEATTRPRTVTETTGTASKRQDELSRKMNLPFAPAIAMDPVDGSKVSISPDTPVTEYKNRLYYFSSAKNRQAFVANPDTYLKEKLATY
jgi:YHS domain-containing protein